MADPVSAVEALAASEGQIGLPRTCAFRCRAELYGEKRTNSSGLDLSNEQRLASPPAPCSPALAIRGARSLSSTPNWIQGVEQPVINPAEPGDVVGYVREATEGEVQPRARRRRGLRPICSLYAADGARELERAAELMENQLQSLLGILVRVAGKAFQQRYRRSALAVDFTTTTPAGCDDFASDSHRPAGPVGLHQPWNFPLAIFTGKSPLRWRPGNNV